MDSPPTNALEMAAGRCRTLAVGDRPAAVAGFPTMDPLTFGQLVLDGGGPIAAVEHLIFSSWVLSFHGLLGRCERLVSLWIDEVVGLDGFPTLRGLEALPSLRELTVPFWYAVSRERTFAALALPTVTHLFFCGVETWRTADCDAAALAGFPNLTHLGFSCEPTAGTISAALAASGAPGVLVCVVFVPRRPDPRVVYLPLSFADPLVLALSRAAPGWTLWELPVRDHWAFLDEAMAARAVYGV